MRQETVTDRSWNRYETILDSFSGQTNGNSTIYADVSREVRFENRASSNQATEITSVCAGVAGPVLCSYVLWMLSRSVEMGLKRIYFISRDGELLLEIARRLLPAFWPESSMELRYLLGSRRAWLLPSFALSQANLAPYLLSFLHNSSFKIMFDRVALTHQECEPILLKHGFTADEWERTFSLFDLQKVKALVGDPDFQSCVQRRALEFKDSAVGYLAQEGLFDDVPYAMVDLGWSGASKGAFEQILSVRQKAPPPFFLFGRIEGKRTDDQSVTHTYLFNVDQGIGTERRMDGINIIMEIFCASTSRGLLHYERIGCKYEAVLREAKTELVLEWGLETMRAEILRVVEEVAMQVQRFKAPPFLPPETSDALLKAFWLTPTREEADAWGTFPFEEDPSSASPGRLITRVRWINLWRLFIYGRGFRDSCEWRGGIIATLSPFMRFLWKICPVGFHVRKSMERFFLRRR